jgi:hypothetical protein
MGSNHRKRKLRDLQSPPFDHSGTYPFSPVIDLASKFFSVDGVLLQEEMRLFSFSADQTTSAEVLLNKRE